MKSENIKKIVISIFILLSIFILDRISKILILNILEETGRVDIYINSFLNFYLVIYCHNIWLLHTYEANQHLQILVVGPFFALDKHKNTHQTLHL